MIGIGTKLESMVNRILIGFIDADPVRASAGYSVFFEIYDLNNIGEGESYPGKSPYKGPDVMYSTNSYESTAMVPMHKTKDHKRINNTKTWISFTCMYYT